MWNPKYFQEMHEEQAVEGDLWVGQPLPGQPIAPALSRGRTSKQPIGSVDLAPHHPGHDFREDERGEVHGPEHSAPVEVATEEHGEGDREGDLEK